MIDFFASNQNCVTINNKKKIPGFLMIYIQVPHLHILFLMSQYLGFLDLVFNI